MTPTPSESGGGGGSGNGGSSGGSSSMPLRPALKPEGDEPASPKSGPKVVSIAEPEPEPEPEPLDEPSSPPRPRQYTAGVATRRLSGRPNMPTTSSSRLSTVSQSSVDADTETAHASKHLAGLHKHEHSTHHHHHPHLHHRGQHHAEKLLSQVADWLQAEKAKRAARKGKRRGDGDRNKENDPEGIQGSSSGHTAKQRTRTESMSSDSSSISLEKLQQILEDSMSTFGGSLESLPLGSPLLGSRRSSRRRSSARKLGGWASSDTEHQDGDVVVPSADVVLDNSKTMSYSGGAATSDNALERTTSRRAEKERRAWLQFKSEIVRLSHTLRLKGWRRVPLERGGDIEVVRLSGALTNAVYVVSPPKDLPPPASAQKEGTSDPKPHSLKPPPKLLLRIYGPQVEHLIDRENELGILRRLARKKIGPRLLGTFTNGRFEEFFNAQTLKAEDLRVEDTMKQIAKRMRELHEGVELLPREREEGPFVLRNWDKWVDRCEEIITYLDGEIISGNKGKGESWRDRGLVCGVEWKVFKSAVDKYRKWLYEYYKKRGGVESRLVFAHNDTQYGNILRIIPPSAPEPGEDGTRPPPSPLLLPQNHHKQLVVIDFEYASANTPGLEFANHFTEWCYNYASPSDAEACHTSRYPTIEQQKRFIRSYVDHRPQFSPVASATPKLVPMDGGGGTAAMRGGVGEFLLDSRAPPGSSSSVAGVNTSMSSLNLKDDYPASLAQRSPSLHAQEHGYFADQEQAREADAERQVAFLMEETRLWRVACSAQWVAWGIVQAKLPDACPNISGASPTDSPSLSPERQQEIQESETGVKEQASAKEDKDKRPEGLIAEALLNGESARDAEAEGEPEEDDEFDYLAYAQQRALFFWGDVLALGIVKKEELPEALVGRVKRVEF